MAHPADTDSQFSIMVVDDVPDNLDLLSHILRRQGYKMRPAPSGRLALEAAAHSPPDLILLDIHMPEMDGFETCRRLKSEPALRDIPVLFISALSDARDKVRAFEIGGVDYITKPFHAEEVLARVATHLSLQRYRMELERQNAQLREALTQLQEAQNMLVRSEKMAALGVLVAGVAHEINNPVNFIKTSLHGLQRDFNDLIELADLLVVNAARSTDPALVAAVEADKARLDYGTLTQEVPDLIANMAEGIRRTEEIVDGLRTFARQEEVPREEIDLSACIASALAILKNRCKQIAQLRKDYKPLPPVFGKAGAISQVLVNVLANAIDALEQGANPQCAGLTIATRVEEREQKRYAVVAIGDTGPGIPAEIIDRVFDPFFTTKDVGQGTGLGLYICNNIVREHDGFIEVDSTPTQGTTVSIHLPIRQETRP